MHEALVQDAENDVDGEQRCRDEQRLGRERELELMCGALKGRLQGIGFADRGLGALNGFHRIAERIAWRKIERERHRCKLALVVDGKRSRSGLERRKLAQRDKASSGSMHINSRR
jgi:hypothetical protein